MVDEDRYCIDVLTQIDAVTQGARRASRVGLLDEHVRHCVAGALTSGDDGRRAATKTEELLEAVQRFARTR